MPIRDDAARKKYVPAWHILYDPETGIVDRAPVTIYGVEDQDGNGPYDPAHCNSYTLTGCIARRLHLRRVGRC